MNNQFSKQEVIEKDGDTIVICVRKASDGSFFIQRTGSKNGPLWSLEELRILRGLIERSLEDKTKNFV